jgi:hypothetical protein
MFKEKYLIRRKPEASEGATKAIKTPETTGAAPEAESVSAATRLEKAQMETAAMMEKLTKVYDSNDASHDPDVTNDIYERVAEIENALEKAANSGDIVEMKKTEKEFEEKISQINEEMDRFMETGEYITKAEKDYKKGNKRLDAIRSALGKGDISFGAIQYVVENSGDDFIAEIAANQSLSDINRLILEVAIGISQGTPESDPKETQKLFKRIKGQVESRIDIDLELVKWVIVNSPQLDTGDLSRLTGSLSREKKYAIKTALRVGVKNNKTEIVANN